MPNSERQQRATGNGHVASGKRKVATAACSTRWARWVHSPERWGQRTLGCGPLWRPQMRCSRAALPRYRYLWRPNATQPQSMQRFSFSGEWITWVERGEGGKGCWIVEWSVELIIANKMQAAKRLCCATNTIPHHTLTHTLLQTLLQWLSTTPNCNAGA